MPYPFKSIEEIENSVFFPLDDAIRLGKNNIFKIWEHLTGDKKLSNKELSHLSKKGFFKKEKYSLDSILKMIKSKKPQKLSNLPENIIKICEWCDGETLVLHEHHFPIPKKNGGKDIVSICACCHYEFHYLENSYIYMPSDEIQKLWDGGIAAKENAKEEFMRVRHDNT